MPVTIGTDRDTGKQVSLDPDVFRTHLHLLGATGSGKTTAIITMVRQILRDPRPRAALFLVDPMGNLSHELLKWIATPRLCPEHVRERLLYIQPSVTDFVLPFNPLLHTSEDDLYYRVARTLEIVLRAWASQNIQEMPRLRTWTFASFFSAARMGYPLAACRYLLRPGSDENKAMLKRLPAELQNMWSQISSSTNEALRQLESTRSRLAPFFDSGILRRMFSSIESRFDVPRLIRERRIVIINLGSYETIDTQMAATIGGLIVNEILQRAASMPPRDVNPTYLLLDEFQHFVGPDLYDALPTVRQMGLRLMLAHQSFSQLERGDIDLSGIIWQARSRLVFASDAEDADRVAHELATLRYDPMKIKETLYTLRQRIAGHRREMTRNWNRTDTDSTAEDVTQSTARGNNRTQTRSPLSLRPTIATGVTDTSTRGTSEKRAHSSGSSEGGSETLVPIHEDFYEISSKTYYSFDEQRTLWAQRIRERKTGAAFGKFRDDPNVYDLDIMHHPLHDSPALERAVDELKSRNFASEFFVSKSDVEREEEHLRRRILTDPPIVIENQCMLPPPSEDSGTGEVPFR